MRNLVMSLSLVSSVSFAANNTFIEQNLSKIQERNAIAEQSATYANQQSALQTHQVQQSFDSKGMRLILDKNTAKQVKPVAPIPSQPPQPSITPSPKQQPLNTTNLPRPVDGATGFNHSSSSNSEASTARWTYGY